MNPLVELEVDTSNLRDKSRQYYEKFNLIILIDQDYDVIDQANIICRENKIAYVFEQKLLKICVLDSLLAEFLVGLVMDFSTLLVATF